MENAELVILEPAVLNLADHLRRNGAQVAPGDVRTKVEKGLRRSWGTPHSKPFNDSVGAGWLVDLSEQFNDEMLYGVVRSSGGSRQLVAVVEADAIEALQKTKKALPSIEEAYGAEVPSGSTAASAPVSGTAKTPPSPAGVSLTADSPTLVLVMGSAPAPENFIRTTNGQVRDVVAKLLQDGIRPEQVEIWTGVRKPKVQIAFE